MFHQLNLVAFLVLVQATSVFSAGGVVPMTRHHCFTKEVILRYTHEKQVRPIGEGRAELNCADIGMKHDIHFVDGSKLVAIAEKVQFKCDRYFNIMYNNKKVSILGCHINKNRG